ncbi:MerR family transcriptional regulator [Ktedonospora formicarum]|uniref:Transcriptional regulator n=1 Tax=Ktedonospora formicarum TaxID=2778364 RepID=A0A8J3HYP2_9CHLR|nr:MerR family transcriptional regulator [Ktedonospora formicarum]GHO42379.1 transcriptional regulator [Ktedonospora formicarum]
MQISELARLTGTSVRSLRYYEARGLIKARRLENGYRDYDGSIVEQIRAIRMYLEMGLNTDEIGRIVSCKGLNIWGEVDPTFPECGDNVLAIYTHKLHSIDVEMRTLSDIKSRLLQKVHFIKDQR